VRINRCLFHSSILALSVMIALVSPFRAAMAQAINVSGDWVSQ
jgi:hypothetical protein